MLSISGFTRATVRFASPLYSKTTVCPSESRRTNWFLLPLCSCSRARQAGATPASVIAVPSPAIVPNLSMSPKVAHEYSTPVSGSDGQSEGAEVLVKELRVRLTATRGSSAIEKKPEHSSRRAPRNHMVLLSCGDAMASGCVAVSLSGEKTVRSKKGFHVPASFTTTGST
eukprot:750733-Hanusia_phi.AAC.16